MSGKSYGAGTIFQRSEIWRVSFWSDGRQIQKSSGSTRRQDAVRLRDQLLGKKARGELGPAAADKVSCGQLLDDLLEHARHNVKASTERIWKLVVEASLRPYFGHRKAASLSTAILKEYRRKRLAEGRSEATCNRELSMLRTAFHLGRKCTPPKVGIVPFGGGNAYLPGIPHGRAVRIASRRVAGLPETAVCDGLLYRRPPWRTARDPLVPGRLGARVYHLGLR